MPIYGYRCSECQHELELLQSMSDAPLTQCPQCGGRLQKLLYPVGVHFKGSGFYSTDYKKNGGSKTSSEQSEGKGEGSANGSSSESKSSESKSEGKSESKSDSSSSTKSESSSGQSSSSSPSSD
jgi:putative FmdB family regulatory protein